MRLRLFPVFNGMLLMLLVGSGSAWADSGGASPPSVVAQCAACHSSSNGPGPQIPFGDPSALKPLLGNGGYAHGTLSAEIVYRITSTGSDRMPMGGQLSGDEIRDLEAYLQSLEQ